MTQTDNRHTAQNRNSDTRRTTALQFMKYLAVGALNTVVTLLVIWVCKSAIGINPFVSNAIGYVAGVINSFVWNKMWVFQADGHITRQAVRFLVGFAICYGIQFALVWGTMELTPFGTMEWTFCGFTLSGYGVITILAMGVYTICNFLYNKLISFR